MLYEAFCPPDIALQAASGAATIAAIATADLSQALTTTLTDSV